MKKTTYIEMQKLADTWETEHADDPTLREVNAKIAEDTRAEKDGERVELVTRSHRGHSTVTDIEVADWTPGVSDTDTPEGAAIAYEAAAELGEAALAAALDPAPDDQDRAAELDSNRDELGNIIDPNARAGYHGYFADTDRTSDRRRDAAREAEKAGQEQIDAVPEADAGDFAKTAEGRAQAAAKRAAYNKKHPLHLVGLERGLRVKAKKLRMWVHEAYDFADSRGIKTVGKIETGMDMRDGVRVIYLHDPRHWPAANVAEQHAEQEAAQAKAEAERKAKIAAERQAERIAKRRERREEIAREAGQKSLIG